MYFGRQKGYFEFEFQSTLSTAGDNTEISKTDISTAAVYIDIESTLATAGDNTEISKTAIIAAARLRDWHILGKIVQDIITRYREHADHNCEWPRTCRSHINSVHTGRVWAQVGLHTVCGGKGKIK